MSEEENGLIMKSASFWIEGTTAAGTPLHVRLRACIVCSSLVWDLRQHTSTHPGWKFAPTEGD